ncbi:hypothetical protein K7X08_028911 [Anisodus acutangulus]|uniref:Uncharacterized protein n=1 Tax=Anisodus acutangulus TaxID=402998 RepID=A0A9Q1L1P4_9SOLA|nr:hypothetical protein K7X08_028911 [Anisodus acutangulus]
MICLHLLAQIASPSYLESRAAEIEKFEVVFKDGDRCERGCWSKDVGSKTSNGTSIHQGATAGVPCDGIFSPSDLWISSFLPLTRLIIKKI